MVARLTKAIGAAAVAGSLPWASIAQDLGPGGVQYQFSIAQGVSAESDFALYAFGTRGATYGSTSLSFGVSSETRTERIALEGGATLRLLPSFARDGGADVAEPFVALTYSRDAARSGLTLAASHRREGLAFVDRFVGVIGPDGGLIPLSAPEDVDGGGSRAVSTLAARMDLGRDLPVSYDFGVSLTRTDLFGATDPDLEEATGGSADLSVTLALSPDLSGRVRTEYSLSDERDLASTRSEEARLIFGVIYEPTEAFSLSVEAGPVWQRERSFGTTLEDLGATGSLSATWSGPRSLVILSLDGTEVGGDRSYAGSVEWRASFETGQLLALARYDVIPGDATEPDETTSFLGVGYLYDLSPIAQLGISLASSETEAAGVAGLDRSQTIGASYRRALSRDVALQAGYQYRWRDAGAPASAESHGLFLEISFATEGLF